MSDKTNILIVADHYLPGFKAGEPIVSLSALVEQLRQHISIAIVTRNYDFNEYAPYQDTPVNQWLSNYGVQIFYFCSLKQYASVLLNKNYDVIYLNSFFSVLSIIALALNRLGWLSSKIVLAPRGELSKAALGIKSKKKTIYLTLAKRLGFFKTIDWHATSFSEQEDIIREFSQPVTLLPNLITPSFLDTQPALRSKNVSHVKLVFFSRISQKKNLDFSLSLLKKSNVLVDFDIWGPIEDQPYWQHCQALISELPPNIKVDYKGSLPRDQVKTVLPVYHALLLPTLNENFGHAIVECMALGVVPIISDQTPWQNLAKLQVGWDIQLSDERLFIEVIQRLAAMSEPEWQLWSLHAQQFIRQQSSIPMDDYLKLLSV